MVVRAGLGAGHSWSSRSNPPAWLRAGGKAVEGGEHILAAEEAPRLAGVAELHGADETPLGQLRQEPTRHADPLGEQACSRPERQRQQSVGWRCFCGEVLAVVSGVFHGGKVARANVL